METKFSFVGLAFVVLVALFALASLEYNLRASVRLLVYAGLAAIALRVVFGTRAGLQALSSQRP